MVSRDFHTRHDCDTEDKGSFDNATTGVTSLEPSTVGETSIDTSTEGETPIDQSTAGENSSEQSTAREDPPEPFAAGETSLEPSTTGEVSLYSPTTGEKPFTTLGDKLKNASARQIGNKPRTRVKRGQRTDTRQRLITVFRETGRKRKNLEDVEEGRRDERGV